MKTHFKRITKSTLAVVLTLCMLFSCIMATDAAVVSDSGVVGGYASDSVGATWSFSGGKIYFDNTRTKWNDSSIQLCIGKNKTNDNYTSTYTMTAVTNSNGDLYYADLPSSGWGDATYMAVIGNSNDWGSGKWGSSNLSNATHRTGTYTSGLTSSSGGRYYLIPSASTNGSSLTLSGTYQYNQKAYSYYSTDGTSYSSGTTGGTTSIKAAYFNSDTSWTYTMDTTTPTAAWNNAVYGCTATFTATAKTGYEFVGWFSSTSATTATSTNATYTTVVRQANNLYARFKKSATNYTGITAVAKGTTDGTDYSVDLGSIQSSTTVSSSTGLSVSAPDKEGYTFSKWVASGSGTFDSATSASTTFHPAANSEVATAQYKKTYSVTKSSPSNGSITLNKTTVSAGEDFVVTLAPEAGYKVASFTVDGVDKMSSLSNNEYTHTATGTGNSIEVKATFEAIPGTTIYIKKNISTFTHIHIWSTAEGNKALSDAGQWPGDKFTGWSSNDTYYYKTYNWDCAGFKVILNDGKTSNATQTSDSDAYATGGTYYITSATARTDGNDTSHPAVLTTNTTYTGLSAIAKYSTTGASGSYNDTLTYAPTKSAASGTQLDGITVTAQDTVTESGATYKFYHWSCDASDGTFTSGSNNDNSLSTTFYPLKNGATAIALYKKVYTITASVDNTGTGAGTVTTSKTSVEAGGSYTITANAASVSAIESVKVNGTAKTATASQTISSVSADQTVLVKFKSNVYLKGTMNSTAWAGDVMTANSDGTTYTKSEVVLNAGTVYEFKHFVDSGSGVWSNTAPATWTLNGIATHGTKDDGNGSTNLTITPSVKAKVTFVSDGTKFTSITAVPYDATRYSITFKKVTGSTITGTYMGTSFSTERVDAVVEVYSGTDIEFTVTGTDTKYVSSLTGATFSPAFTAGSTYTGKIENVTSAATVTPAAADKLKVSVSTNNATWGTLSVDKATAAPGETVTITVAALSGSIKTIKVINTSTKEVVKTFTFANGTLQTSAAASLSASSLAREVVALSKRARKAAIDPVGADADLSFTMPEAAVSVEAEYEEYVGTSTWVYNGYDTGGNAKSGYYQQPMAEGSVNGAKYAYYNVTGRGSENYDQLFTVSDTSAAGTGYVYFTRPKNHEKWSNSTNPYAYFWNSSGQVGSNWPGSEMTWIEKNDYDEGIYKIAIPSGATKVKFNDNTQTCYRTVEIDLTTTNGCYYLSGGGSGTDADGYHVSEWGTPKNDAGLSKGVEYYKNTAGINYSDHWFTGGFGNYNANSHQFARPSGTANSQDLNNCKDDYYIVVLYPNTSYTFNNNTESTGSDPVVLWMATLPGQTATVSSTVKVYAKDGAIRRDNDQPERNDKTYSYFEQHANTFIYSDNGYATHIGTRSSNDGQTSEGTTGYNGYTYDYVAKFNKGDTLYIKTNLDSELMENLYLAAYSINGKSYQIHTVAESATGSVTEAFTVPEDFEDNYIEITPIYFPKVSTNCITFYIEGYDETVMNAGWGNTPFVYPFYQDSDSNYVANINNAFGGYPGQPMVFYQGNYYTMLPKTYTTVSSGGQQGVECFIKGVTLGNGYWDDIHKLTGEVKSHYQTYDYDDLYKIYEEHKAQADHIICGFKYETKKNNDEPGNNPTYANYNSTNGNGWEVLTDYYGNPVDIFGNILEGDAKTLAESIIADPALADSAAVVHAISQDYKSNSAGDYATEWAIYNTAGTKVVATSGGKTTIVPSALAITDSTHFANYDTATKAFQSIYEALKADTNVLNKPAVVTYEKSIYGGGDKADRCDARWYFSQKYAPINATTRIEYTDDGKNWQIDTYTSGTGTGSTTDTKAYFTGKAEDATSTPTTGISGTNTTSLAGASGAGYYTFNAENAGQYEFVGWYLLRDNYQNISVRSSYASDATEFPSHAQQSKNGDIFVARFKKTATGTFDIYHEVHPQTTGYGTVDVSAVAKNGDTILHTYPSTGAGSTSHIQIGNDYIRSGEGNTVVATFTASPYPTSHFDAFYATVQSLLQDFAEYDYIKSISISNNVAIVTYDVDKLFTISGGSPVQTVTNVTHYSKFSLKDDLTYSLQYTFNTRYYGTKLFNYTNVKFTEQELRSYFLNQITDPDCDHIKLDKQFVKAKAPFESNYREDLTWVVDNVTFNNNSDPTIGYLTATQVSKKWSTATVYDFTNDGNMVTATMVAPYEKLFDKSVETKPTYANDDAEVSAIKSWSVADDDMYHPIRTSYVPSGQSESVPLYIHHWDIYQLDSFAYKTDNNLPKMKDDGYNLDVDLSKSKLVAQAYSSRFNYVGYDDYAIVPVYTTNAITSADRQGYSDNRTDSSATLLTITRNQWNASAAGSTGKDADDRIYIDFMLNYNYSVTVNNKKTNILLNSTEDNIVAGFVVRSYTWENEQKVYGTKSQVIVVNKSQINDKNRLEYCYGIQNTENNRRSGLYYEFTPFIIDKNTTGAGSSITLPNNVGTYNALYADNTVTVLDQVSFYQLGRL